MLTVTGPNLFDLKMQLHVASPAPIEVRWRHKDYDDREMLPGGRVSHNGLILEFETDRGMLAHIAKLLRERTKRRKARELEQKQHLRKVAKEAKLKSRGG